MTNPKDNVSPLTFSISPGREGVSSLKVPNVKTDSEPVAANLVSLPGAGLMSKVVPLSICVMYKCFNDKYLVKKTYQK